MEDLFYLGTEPDEELAIYEAEIVSSDPEEKVEVDEVDEVKSKEKIDTAEFFKEEGEEYQREHQKELAHQEEVVERNLAKLEQKYGSLDKAVASISQPAPRQTSEPKLSKEDKVEQITEVIASMSDAIAIPNMFGEPTLYKACRQAEDGPVVYWSEAFRPELEQLVYNRICDARVCAKAGCRLPATANNVKLVTDTLLFATHAELGMGRRRAVMISSKYIKDNGAEVEATYYDMQRGEIVEYSDLEEELKGKCFSRFCNTISEVMHVPVIPEESIDLKLVREYADMARHDMEAWYETHEKGKNTRGKYRVRFEDTFLAWACGNEDLYRDIITMCATPLMVRKPECTFFILGEKSNGKSSLRHLLQCVYGVRNSANVQIAQMGSWDYASTLLGKVINFPDEESTNLEDMDISAFKSMSTHENLQIRKKGSSVPFDISCDFVSIIPLNAYPNWKALDGGVARRVRILPFNADFSAESQKGGLGFEETKYTPKFISAVIGELIGVASFYAKTGKDIVWSDATNNASGEWEREKVNAPLFKQDFDKVFHGFQSVNLLYECYQNWCKGGLGDVDTGIEYQWETRKRIREIFCQFGGYNRNTVLLTISGGVHVTKGDNPCPIEWALWEGATIDVGHIGGLPWGTERGVMTVREILDMGADPITLKLMEQGLERTDAKDAKDV